MNMKFTSLSNSVPVFLISLLIFSLYADKCDATFWPFLKAIEIEGCKFRPFVTPPGSTQILFLAGSGVKEEFGDSKSMKYSSCAIYLQPTCILYLAKAWAQKSVVDITQSLNFFMDIATGPFEKYCRITMLETAKGEDYAAMITKNCEEMLTNSKRYSETAKAALTKFSEAFNGRTLASGSSIHVTVSTSNSVTLAFTEDGSTPKQGDVTLDCKEVGEAFLMSTISLHTTIRESMGSRISGLYKSKIIIDDGPKNDINGPKNFHLDINLGTGQKPLFDLDNTET
ncbi:chalcone--flavonone isomerase 2-like [Papaver somniferum]|uniref:chalcone--flavonone isomerase 2-like n=1 Tax=Papaver somniferum TaxID=3469 RepID=UPI000E6F7994|nr:chalcone--flavonone isomerase 2-like [Papaver somniferum]